MPQCMLHTLEVNFLQNLETTLYGVTPCASTPSPEMLNAKQLQNVQQKREGAESDIVQWSFSTRPCKDLPKSYEEKSEFQAQSAKPLASPWNSKAWPLYVPSLFKNTYVSKELQPLNQSCSTSNRAQFKTARLLVPRTPATPSWRRQAHHILQSRVAAPTIHCRGSSMYQHSL